MPRFLMGSALIFWGWQTGLWIFAVIMAVVLEGASSFVRWELSLADFIRISDICTLIFVGMVIYLFATKPPMDVIFIAIQWLPIAFFPIIAAQSLSTIGKIDIRALSLIFRRTADDNQPFFIDIAYPYFILCVLSASAANVRAVWFYAGCVFLCAWALFFVRSRRFSIILWLLALAFAVYAGYIGHIGLSRLQAALEQKSLEWFTDFLRKPDDLYRNTTAIGDIERLKPSSRILFRVISKDKPPILLRDESYNTYSFSTWFVTGAGFLQQMPENESTWNLRPDPKADKSIIIETRNPKWRKLLLKLPNGLSKIEQLPVAKMEMNRFGAIQTENGPGFLSYLVLFNPEKSIDSPPDDRDLLVPENEQKILSQILDELLLNRNDKNIDTDLILKILSSFFDQNFRYSLELDRTNSSNTPLYDFLTRYRAGHCEYFATAAVLLLRSAGIPARYATGYAVHDYRGLNTYVVRERHAHAWALVWKNGAWHDFDATPPSWMAIESDKAPAFEFIYDMISWSMFSLSKWRWQGSLASHLMWLLVPLIFILARRLYLMRKIKRRTSVIEKNLQPVEISGADSEFNQIIQKLNSYGYVRYPGETLSEWLKRIEKNSSESERIKPLFPILSIHYRYRFDPKGILPEERNSLALQAKLWIDNE